MEKPILSPDFTIEDIHKLREYNYYITKDMTPQERRNFYNERGRAFQREIEAEDCRKKYEEENFKDLYLINLNHPKTLLKWKDGFSNFSKTESNSPIRRVLLMVYYSILNFREAYMINQIKIGQFIAESRKNLNLTQKQLAEEIGVTDKTISKWETGNRLPDAALLMDLCRVLQVDVNELLKGEKVKPENYDQNVSDNLVDLVGEINVIKQEKSGQYIGMIFGVVSIVCAIAIVLMKSLGTAGLSNFLDVYTLLLLVGIICLILTATGCFHDFISVWKVCILRKRISEREMKAAVQTVSFACLVTLIVGVIISAAGIVSVVGQIGMEESLIGPSMAQTVLSVLYTALLELILVIGLFKLKKRSAAWHIGNGIDFVPRL